MTVRLIHPDSPAHPIEVTESAVERYASQGWREDVPTDADGTDADDD